VVGIDKTKVLHYDVIENNIAKRREL